MACKRVQFYETHAVIRELKIQKFSRRRLRDNLGRLGQRTPFLRHFVELCVALYKLRLFLSLHGYVMATFEEFHLRLKSSY